MLNEKQILKMYKSKMEHVAMFMYNTEYFIKMLDTMHKLGIFSEMEVLAYPLELKASTQTMAVILGRNWAEDLESYKDSF